VTLAQLIRGVARRLRPAAGASPEIIACRERLARMRAQLDKRRLAAERLAEEARGLREGARAAARDAAAQLHQVPSADVLEHLLPARAAAARARVAASAAARERDATFTAASPAYRAALGVPASALADRADEIAADGLRWWVPRDRRGRRQAPQQWLRLRPILQSREVATGAVMLDIGAHVGRMAIPRVLLGDGQAVYAAEPDPLNYTCLVHAVVANGLRGCVLPDQVAIGARNGTASLLRSRSSGGHRLAAGHPAPPGAEVIEVAETTLDAWVTKLGVEIADISFVQVDTQGTECDVLAGASRLLASPHIAWEIRIDPRLIASAGHTLDELMDVLARSFTHVIDLHKRASGPRVRPTSELKTALEYLWTDEAETEVLLYSVHGDRGSGIGDQGSGTRD
jgi:FkbM family methyltransferase